MTRAFWNSLTLLAVYLVAFGSFVLSGVDRFLARLAAGGASSLLWLLTGVDIATTADHGTLWFHVPGGAATQVQSAMVIIYVPLFIAVASIASIHRYDRLFWFVLPAGVIVIFALETLALTARVWAYGATVLGTGILFQFFQVFLYLSERGLAAVPAFVAALLLWNRPREPRTI